MRVAGSWLAREFGLLELSFHLVLDHRSPVGDDELVVLLVHLEELEAKALGRRRERVGGGGGGGSSGQVLTCNIKKDRAEPSPLECACESIGPLARVRVLAGIPFGACTQLVRVGIGSNHLVEG